MSDHIYEENTAPQLLGVVWNWFLYGVLVVQFYVYSYNFVRDSRRIKLLGHENSSLHHLLHPDEDFVVYSIFFLETVQTVLSGADLYYWFAASPTVAAEEGVIFVAPFASFFDLQILGSVVALTVQLFFVYRIRVLSRLNEKPSQWLCIIICLLSVIGAIGAFTAGIISHVMGEFNMELVQPIPAMTWVIANTLSDSLIASAMLHHLRRVWARDGYLSNHVLVSIVRLTVETNLVTTSVSIVSLITMARFSENIYYMCPTYVLGKLYSNTLLVSLNNRISIRDMNEARGVAIDRQVVAVPDYTRSDGTRDTIILDAVKPQQDLMKQPVAETEVEERVDSPATVDAV